RRQCHFRQNPFRGSAAHVGEAAFKRHQVAPINPRLAFDAMPAHMHLRVDRLRTADQHSLRIAAAEGTSPAEGTVIYQRYRPPCSTHSRARRLRGSAGADDHEIVGFHEVVPSKSKSKDGQDGRVNSIIPSNRPAPPTHTPRSPQSNPHSTGRTALRSPIAVPPLEAFGRRPPCLWLWSSAAGIRNPTQKAT